MHFVPEWKAIGGGVACEDMSTVNKESGHLLNLKEALSLKHIASDKIAGFRCCSSMRNRQKVTSAAEAEI